MFVKLTDQFKKWSLHLSVIVVRLLSVTAVNCPEGQKACADGSACIPQSDFCDGVQNCADGTDEDHTVCGTYLRRFHNIMMTDKVVINVSFMPYSNSVWRSVSSARSDRILPLEKLSRGLWQSHVLPLDRTVMHLYDNQQTHVCISHYFANSVFHFTHRVTEGSAIKIVFHTFQTEQDIDILELYEGTGPTKTLTCEITP